MRPKLLTILALALLFACALAKPYFTVKNNKIYDQNGG